MEQQQVVVRNDMEHIMYSMARFTMRLEKMDHDNRRLYGERIARMEEAMNRLISLCKRPYACPVCEGGVLKHLAAHGHGYGTCVACNGKGLVWDDVA